MCVIGECVKEQTWREKVASHGGKCKEEWTLEENEQGEEVLYRLLNWQIVTTCSQKDSPVCFRITEP